MTSQNLVIMHIDDDTHFIKLSKAILEHKIKKNVSNSTINLVSVSDIDDITNMLENYKPDLILCDYQMPQFNGLDILMYIRMREQLHNIPFILFSSYCVDDFEEVLDELFNYGGDYYLCKKDKQCWDTLLNLIQLYLLDYKDVIPRTLVSSKQKMQYCSDEKIYQSIQIFGD